jgi:hypothetical protein
VEIKIPVQELSDGRFRNALTGKIGDSVRAVVLKDAIVDRGKFPIKKELSYEINEDSEGFHWYIKDGYDMIAFSKTADISETKEEAKKKLKDFVSKTYGATI